MATDDLRYELAQEIRMCGITVMRGNGSLGVIYNNLLGLNFRDPGDHQQYLQHMKGELSLDELGSCTTLTFMSNLTEVACGRIGDPLAQRVADHLELDALKQQFLDLQREVESLERAHAIGQDLPHHEQRLSEIDLRMAGSPFTIHPDAGLVLKTETVVAVDIHGA